MILVVEKGTHKKVIDKNFAILMTAKSNGIDTYKIVE